MRRPMINNSVRGDAIYEPFAGSGSTLIAAESIGRVCIAMEIDPRYCDVTVRRWQVWTDKTAKLAGDETSFDQINEERIGKANLS